jgi:glycosyltransferase involved in cell wall biosynthesis
MKICQVDPGCGISIPPKSWGAIEKIVWEFKTNQEKLGHEVHIRLANDIKPGEFDVVHCHVANLCKTLVKNNIPYIYQLHDHHAYHYGKDSYLFHENLEAIEESLVSLMPGKFLVDYFDNPKCKYFSHGVNIDFYQPNLNTPKTGDFLMVANNGLAGDQSFDRKGFNFGVALAAKTGKRLTIAGPKNNRHWLNANPWVLNNPLVEFEFDPSQERVKELYQTHEIFLHPSMLEAGHPNLTLLEAAACGMPIIGWIEKTTDFHGLWRSPRDILDMESGYNDIRNKKQTYVNNSISTAENLSWFNRSKEIVKIYQQFI